MRKRKQMLAVLLVAVLLVTGTFNPISATAKEVDSIEVKSSGAITKLNGTEKLTDLAEKLTASGESKDTLGLKYSPDDLVEVIVELYDNSLLETYTEMNESASVDEFKEYVASDSGKALNKKLVSTQDKVLQKINSLTSNSNSKQKITTLYNYTTVLNGFSVKVKYSALEQIKKISEVKSAYIAPTYELISPTMTESVPFIGADKTWEDAGYKGEGTVVAVVDTGLETSHEAFSYQPTSPKISKDDITTLISTTDLSAEKNTDFNSEQVYVSSKIPYVFDYADKDSIVSGGGDHGTHVAGTIAASGSAITVSGGAVEIEDGILGVAPEAQLVILKVFGDSSSGASTTDILAALDDAVKIGVDAINMSLGSSAGFTYEAAEGIEAVYNRIVESGINLVCSAGNSYSLSYANNLGGKSLTSNPDTSVVGSPSTYEASLSVASLKNSGLSIEKFTADGRSIEYTDNANKEDKLVSKLIGDQEYVVAGLGTVDDFKSVDVAGKVALVQRGSISFTLKEANAFAAGAIAVIVYNNTAGQISMAVDNYDIPAVSITQEDGKYLVDLENKIININPDNNVDVSGYASDFSSWGVTPDLKLKPEIAAPGEGIYSSVPDGYATMSGTSMASPHIAGATALIKQYINDIYGDALTAIEKEDMINQIMMSTANPVTNGSNLPFSPRKQGAGMLQVYNAVTTGAYLYVKDQNRTKIELGDDVNKTGVYDFSFNVKSITGSAITYDIDTTTITEDVVDSIYLAESPKALSPEVTITADGGQLDGNKLTVGPEEDITVHVSIKLSDIDKAYLNQTFANGEFVEGYVYLNSESDVDLSIPFMGFYGDWTQAPIMDSESLYEGNNYSQTSSEAYNFIYGLYEYILGQNVFASLDGINLPLDKNKIAISPNDDGFFDSVDAVTTSLLRNAKTLTYTITDKANNNLYTSTTEYERKSFYLSSYGFLNYALNMDTWDGLDESKLVLPNDSTYTYKVTGTLDYNDHTSNNVKDSWEFPITIDTEVPQIVSSSVYEKDGKRYLDVEVTDNQYVGTVSLYSIKNGSLSKEIKSEYLNEDTKGKDSVVTFDVTNNIAEEYGFALVDYAINEGDYLVNYNVSIGLDKNKVSLEVGNEATINVTKSSSYITPFVQWTSSDDEIASVVDGVVKAKKVGVVTITATTLFGKSASCAVTVVEKVEPTATVAPTVAPTVEPTTAPTVEPTTAPTTVPTTAPTTAPTTVPTTIPTVPTTAPTVVPTTTPTTVPTTTPTPDTEQLLKKVKVTLSGSKTLYVNDTRNVVVTLPTEITKADASITYKTSNQKVATVSKAGKVIGKKAGKATISTTISVNGVKKTVKITITVKSPSIKITASNSTLSVGKTFTFKAKAYGLTGKITWSVSNSKVASINKTTGKLTAKKKGTTYVIAKLGSVEKKVKLTVK